MSEETANEVGFAADEHSNRVHPTADLARQERNTACADRSLKTVFIGLHFAGWVLTPVTIVSKAIIMQRASLAAC